MGLTFLLFFFVFCCQVTLLGSGLPAGIEKEIEEQARQLCIQHSFSTPDEAGMVNLMDTMEYLKYAQEMRRLSSTQRVVGFLRGGVQGGGGVTGEP